MRSAVARSLLPACLGLLLAGCYTYRPVSTPPPSGTRVRVALEGERSPPDVRPEAGIDGTRPAAGIDATLLGVDEEALVLLLPPGPADRLDRRRGLAGGDTLRVPRSRVTRIEERRLSSTRTALLAGGIVVAAALVVELGRGREGSSAHPRGGQDPAKSVLAPPGGDPF